jgi:rhodanese-related sulfurtransferase
MASLNRQGAPAPDLSPPPLLDAGQVRQMAETEAWLVDLRGRRAFAAGHFRNTVNVEHGTLFSTYVGWLLPDEMPLVLMAEGPQSVALAQLDLTRIGVEALVGQYVGPLVPSALSGDFASYPVRGHGDLADAMRGPGHVALDVRRRDEWETGHLDGALHVPLHELDEQVDDLPTGTLWVHCAAGYRAAIAASLLARRGRDVVLVDECYEPTWSEATRQITSP